MIKNEITVISYEEFADIFAITINGESKQVTGDILPHLIGEFGEPSELVGRSFFSVALGEIRDNGVEEIHMNDQHQISFVEFGIEGWGSIDPTCDVDFLSPLIEEPEWLYWLLKNGQTVLDQAHKQIRETSGFDRYCLEIKV